jgi:gamma-glutamylcyclotransferase (GGCT)/AIG2-like uncharacterized protein YtfP
MENSGQQRKLPFFVYGTLIPGHRNEHHWLGAIRSQQRASLKKGRLYRFPGFPMMVFTDNSDADGDDVVRGSVVYVNEDGYDRVLRSLDALEEYDSTKTDDENFYLRVERDVDTDEGTVVRCYTYVGRQSTVIGLPTVLNNDWAAAVQSDPQANKWWEENEGAVLKTRVTSDE